MSGREKGTVRMNDILDRIYGNKKLSFWIPLATAAVMYILFLLFGESPEKQELLINIPIVAVIEFGSIFFIFYIQVINPRCKPNVLDFYELLFTCGFGLGAVCLGIRFLLNMQDNFSSTIIFCLETWSVISLIHNMRK